VVVCAVGIVAVAAARPMWVQHPLVLARYSLPVLPFILVFLSEGLVALVERANRPAIAPVFATAVVAGAFAIGPLPGYLYNPNQFIGHLRFQFDYDPAENPYITLAPSDPIPQFYRDLAAQPWRTLTLIEMPWRLESNFNPHPWYQHVHRQYVKIGLVTPVCGTWDFGEYPETASGLRLRQFAHLSALLRGESYGADFLVVHLRPWTIPPNAGIHWPDMSSCLPAISERWGAPVYRDAEIVVFKLRS